MSIVTGQDAKASDFISTSAGSGSVGKVPKLNSAGKLDSSFLNGGTTFPATQVFNGTAPTSYTDLNLSAVVGAAKKMVWLKFSAAAESYETVKVKTKGDNNSSQYAQTFSGDNSGQPRDNHILVMTDSNGYVQWYSSPAITFQIYVDAWW